jgi:thiol:disulfide interchange protein DsbD
MRRLATLLLLAALASAGAARAAGTDDLLDPDKAFRFSARALDASTIEVRFAIADGYYLYRERFRFAAEPDSVKLGTPQFPKGEIHQDQFFGKTETFRGELSIRLPVAAGDAQSMKLRVTSQGCADAGVCYTPQEQSAQILLAAASGAPPPFSEMLKREPAPVSRPQTDAPARVSTDAGNDEARFTAMLESGRIWATIAAFFGAGLLLAFTPCVLPMVPILSGIIVGEGHKVTRARALWLSLAYVGGMALTYTAIGISAALSGNLLSAALQNPWVLGAFAGIFVLLALSMFGLYELQLPSGLHTRLSDAHSRLRGGHWGAVALMGVLSAAIVSPCVAAPLAGALLYISQTRDALLGGTALFSMAVGMGVPLLVVGVSEGALLPRTGRWMRSVRHFFGVLLLAVAIWIIAPVIPVGVQMLLWGALLIGVGVFLSAIDPLPQQAGGWARTGKALGILALFVGVAQIAGALSGARDPLKPLGALLGAETTTASPLRFERVKTLAELEARVRGAGRPVMLDFYADWCVSCKEMERFTFSDPQVQARMSGMLLLQADVTANDAEDKALLKRFHLFGPPGTIFFDRAGREIEGLRVIGFEPSEKFLKVLEAATNASYRASSFSQSAASSAK